MLLSLVTAQRGQYIHLLDVSRMTLTGNSCSFQLLEHTKTSRPGHCGPQISFSEFTPDVDICHIRTLAEYLERTKDKRLDHTQPLISYVRPFRPVSRDTISRWLKMVLDKAGINTSIFKPHRTRAAYCSKVKAK